MPSVSRVRLSFYLLSGYLIHRSCYVLCYAAFIPISFHSIRLSFSPAKSTRFPVSVLACATTACATAICCHYLRSLTCHANSLHCATWHYMLLQVAPVSGARNYIHCFADVHFVFTASFLSISIKQTRMVITILVEARHAAASLGNPTDHYIFDCGIFAFLATGRFLK